MASVLNEFTLMEVDKNMGEALISRYERNAAARNILDVSNSIQIYMDDQKLSINLFKITKLLTSASITATVIVMRVTPPRAAAAPTSAYWLT